MLLEEAVKARTGEIKKGGGAEASPPQNIPKWAGKLLLVNSPPPFNLTGRLKPIQIYHGAKSL